MKIQSFLTGIVAVTTMIAFSPVVPMQASQEVIAPLGPSTCRVGDTLSMYGMKWTCQRTSGRNTFIAVSTDANTTGPAGAVGVCAAGDWLKLGTLRLDCRKVGKANKWIGAKPGGVVGRTNALIQARPAAIEGKCKKSSWVQMVGIKVRCSNGSGKAAWTTLAEQPSVQEPSRPISTKAPDGANKTTCLNAWWDKEFAGVVPQLAARQDVGLTDKIWEWCHNNYTKLMTSAQRDAAYAEYFQTLGQLVADEVTRVSAATGTTPCQAAQSVLKPRFVNGFGLIGWDPSGFLPILYKQWQGGPVLGKIGESSINCDTGSISLQLRRHYSPRHEGPYFPALGTSDATWPITDQQAEASWVKAAVCVVWNPVFGNTSPGAAARVVGYNYTNMGDGVNMVAADNEVNKCTYKMAQAAGLPVTWKAQNSVSTLQTVAPDFAGVWHTMANNCSWTLVPADGGPTVRWTPADGPYTTLRLASGDQFASTCELAKSTFEHMIVAPDGLFPLQSLAPGARRPSTPDTCTYIVTDSSALRNPPAASSLRRYGGETVTFDVTTGSDGIGSLLRAVGCGQWNLV